MSLGLETYFDKWSKEEEVKFTDAVKSYGKKWDKVSAYIATKTRQQT